MAPGVTEAKPHAGVGGFSSGTGHSCCLVYTLAMGRLRIARVLGQLLFVAWVIMLVSLVVAFALDLFADPHVRRPFPAGVSFLLVAAISAAYGLRGLLLAPEVASLQRRVAAGRAGYVSRLASQLGPRGDDAVSVRRGGLIYLAIGVLFLLMGISGLPA